MFELEAYFSIQIFFIILRETLETAIIISVLLSFINQNNGPSTTPSPADTELQRKLKLQVWVGAISGLAICLFIGLVFITAFYYIGKDYWSLTERLWEGVFSLLSSAIITIMGLGLLRINKIMKVKWWMKLGDAYDSNKQIQRPSPDEDADADTPEDRVDQKRYFLAILPFITTLREGLEAVVFVGGMGVSNPLTSLPLSIMSGIILGSAIGYLLYKGGNKLSLQYFLIISTCFLYTVSAGLMSRGVWFLELERFVRRCDGFDVSETGSGPGSYDISTSVWHVNCCNGLTDGWWMVFNAIFGWTNSATYGSVGSYIVYWLVVSLWLESKLFEERHGYLPLIPIRFQIKRIKKRIKLYRYIQESHAHQKDHDFDAPYEDLQSNPSVDLERLESHQLLHRA
ncbi:iron permease FTR1 [Yamadazyma tenuis ATCC 10573]|uniref:Iron permease FTR1 n=1 Tax=Candida tenuis (strain ATCC 10573 / BCRC 21748 / CBS 615 / JCM 9827 / NBRC 10315 / NRRL Y-1498 / VKM Y-70) TaxID=590646 RepID=G3BB35_CANTC|nr:iron permease FTR1 [Yamadazyma tenuis ATCC 10573]EGV62131.1 iron permease FTR1 [Yamadazyma tenuis ATCC 10573]